MAWEEDSCICLNMQLIAILSRIGVVYTLLAAKNVLTLEDTSLLTGLSKSHLYKLTCNRQIPHYKPNGKQLYFDRTEIEAWMKQGKVNTIDESEQMEVVYLAKASRK